MRLIAFLRAINVGGHVARMERLRGLFEELDLTNVDTFIASGNVIFDAPLADAAALEQRIEVQLREGLGYDVATFLRTSAELRAVARYLPFDSSDTPATSEQSLWVGFLKRMPDEDARAKLLERRSDVDDFHIHGREMYWLRRSRVNASKFTGAIAERLLRSPATFRNVTTVHRIADKYCGRE